MGKSGLDLRKQLLPKSHGSYGVEPSSFHIFPTERPSEHPDRWWPRWPWRRSQVPEGPAEGFEPGPAAPLGAAARGVAALSRTSGRHVEFGDGQELEKQLDGLHGLHQWSFLNGLSGWWFGCHFLFSQKYWVNVKTSHLTNSMIFQRAGYTTTNQVYN